MIWEQFEERIDLDFYREGDHFWISEFHFGNIEGKISRHTPPMEVELGENRYLHKISSKTGQRLRSFIYASYEAFGVGELPDSRYVMQVFETKEEAVAAYHRSIDFWLHRVEDHRQHINAILHRQRHYISGYRDKVPQ